MEQDIFSLEGLYCKYTEKILNIRGVQRMQMQNQQDWVKLTPSSSKKTSKTLQKHKSIQKHKCIIIHHNASKIILKEQVVEHEAKICYALFCRVSIWFCGYLEKGEYRRSLEESICAPAVLSLRCSWDANWNVVQMASKALSHAFLYHLWHDRCIPSSNWRLGQTGLLGLVMSSHV